MQALRLDEIHAASAILSDRRGIADALTDELAAIAPHALHVVTFFSGPVPLDIDAVSARIGKTGADIGGFAGSYGASQVKWDRWSVRRDDRDTFRRVEMSRSALARYWSRHGTSTDYRRRVICVGDRAVALAGSTVIDDRPIDEETWAYMDERIVATVPSIRLSAIAAGIADGVANDDVVGYFLPDGTMLAAANDAGVASAVACASESLRTRSCHSFVAGGVRYGLRRSEHVQSVEVMELVATRGHALSERDAALVDWVRRGLTNREVAAMLGVPPTTVKKALERLFTKQGASNRVELLRMLDRG
jgi:DNA-binding CsgD family transcriptional regulator